MCQKALLRKRKGNPWNEKNYLEFIHVIQF